MTISNTQYDNQEILVRVLKGSTGYIAGIQAYRGLDVHKMEQQLGVPQSYYAGSPALCIISFYSNQFN